MDPDDLVLGDGEHAEGVVVAQVALHREREAGEIVETVEIAGPDLGLVEGLPVVADVVVGVLDDPLQLAELKFSQLVARHGLDLGLKHVAVVCHRFPPLVIIFAPLFSVRWGHRFSVKRQP